MTQPPTQDNPRRPPLQFSLRSLLLLALAVGLLFGSLKWLGTPAAVSAMVLLILAVSLAAALALVVAIAGTADDDP